MRAAGPQPQPSQTRPIPQLVAITQHLLPDRTKRASSPRQNQTQLQPLSTLSLLPAAKALQLPAIGVPPYRLSPEKRRHNHEHEASHDLTGKKHQGKPTKRSFPAAQPFSYVLAAAAGAAERPAPIEVEGRSKQTARAAQLKGSPQSSIIATSSPLKPSSSRASPSRQVAPAPSPERKSPSMTARLLARGQPRSSDESMTITREPSSSCLSNCCGLFCSGAIGALVGGVLVLLCLHHLNAGNLGVRTTFACPPCERTAANKCPQVQAPVPLSTPTPPQPCLVGSRSIATRQRLPLPQPPPPPPMPSPPPPMPSPPPSMPFPPPLMGSFVSPPPPQPVSLFFARTYSTPSTQSTPMTIRAASKPTMSTSPKLPTPPPSPVQQSPFPHPPPAPTWFSDHLHDSLSTPPTPHPVPVPPPLLSPPLPLVTPTVPSPSNTFDGVTTLAAFSSLVAAIAAAALALWLRYHAHTFAERQLVHTMLGMLGALTVATSIPALRWYVTTFRNISSSRAFVVLIGPSLIGTNCLQLIIIASWVVYRWQLMIESEMRQQDRLQPREWLSPPRQVLHEDTEKTRVQQPSYRTPRAAIHKVAQPSPQPALPVPVTTATGSEAEASGQPVRMETAKMDFRQRLEAAAPREPFDAILPGPPKGGLQPPSKLIRQATSPGRIPYPRPKPDSVAEGATPMQESRQLNGVTAASNVTARIYLPPGMKTEAMPSGMANATAARMVKPARLRSPHQLSRQGSSSLRVPYPQPFATASTAITSPIDSTQMPTKDELPDPIIENVLSWSEARVEAAKQLAERRASTKHLISASEAPLPSRLSSSSRSRSTSPAAQPSASEAQENDLSVAPEATIAGLAESRQHIKTSHSIPVLQQLPVKPYWADQVYSPTPSPTPGETPRQIHV